MKAILFLFMLSSAFSFGQKPVEVKLSLRDGNTISGTTQLADMGLKTHYGQLNIPIQDVSSIQIGTGSDKPTSEKAAAYLKVLNSNASEDLKKGAYNDLVKMGIRAISAITAFQNDDRYTVPDNAPPGEFTIENALAELRSTYNVDETMPVEDLVLIGNQYTMGGTYDFQKLDVKTEYGSLSIPKDKIKTLEVTVITPTGNGEVVVKLLASKHISGNANGGWLKTGLMLKPGQKFSVTASGEVMLASLSNQKYKPDGAYMATNGTPYPAAADEYSAATYPAYGNVVYKIGDQSTEALRAGAKFTGTAGAGGMLYLSIYETVYNAANTGAYTVKISVK